MNQQHRRFGAGTFYNNHDVSAYLSAATDCSDMGAFESGMGQESEAIWRVRVGRD
jgi:hypothetical protein